MKYPLQTPRLYADFNGIFSELLCLSHSDTAKDENGHEVILAQGMIATAYDFDADDDGTPNNIFATGVVEKSPDWLSCRGSRWALRIDDNGFRHDSDVRKGSSQ